MGTNVIAVTVTYGDRAKLCIAACDAALAAGVNSIVIVSNGCVHSSQQLLAHYASNHPHVSLIRLADNTGSAPGFACGIRAALKSDCEFIWLLDDDNVANSDSLEVLSQEWSVAVSASAPEDATAISPIRGSLSDVDASEELGARIRSIYSPLQRSFVDFDWVTFARKIRARRQKLSVEDMRKARIEGTFPVPYAPWGGLFLHRSVFSRFGLPREDFVVYCDDTEFTSRIVDCGGCLIVTPRAVMVDISEKWVSSGFRASGYVTASNEALLYYSVRNHVYTERLRRQKGFSVPFLFNVAGFFMTVIAFSARHRKVANFGIIVRAIVDGSAKELRVNRQPSL